MNKLLLLIELEVNKFGEFYAWTTLHEYEIITNTVIHPLNTEKFWTWNQCMWKSYYYEANESIFEYPLYLQDWKCNKSGLLMQYVQCTYCTVEIWILLCVLQFKRVAVCCSNGWQKWVIFLIQIVHILEDSAELMLWITSFVYHFIIHLRVGLIIIIIAIKISLFA